ncbi:MAG: glycosyltransferase [Bacteroidetes bacterium]|nr:MAG: glycosyltransferase [Bacteroidota bacterium]
MNLLLALTFWLAALLLVYSYFLYPQLLKWIGKSKKNNDLVFEQDEDFPFVSVLMSIYNEESVIEAKMKSLLEQDYPEDKIIIYTGSDCSSDRSNEIMAKFAEQYPRVQFFPFTERNGKPGVINKLAAEALKKHPASSDHIFLITDANVMLTPAVLRSLTQHYKNDQVVIADANMIHVGMKAEGISKSEDFYITSEVTLKNNESRIWGIMAGPFGGCYTIRSGWFCEVPPNFLVDDFYIAMRVLERGGQIINDLDAVCYEAVSHEIKEEFRRKARISAGNFQNLLTFPHLWWPPFKLPGFVLFSHKVIRWFGPFLMILMILTSFVLAITGSSFYKWILFALFAGTIISLVFDKVLNKFGLNIFLLRSVRYFILMNFALFKGFLNFLKGIQHNAWEPPKRN